MIAAGGFLALMARSVGSKAWRRHQRLYEPPAPAPPQPAAANSTCSFGGAWTDGSAMKPVCEAMAWGCHSAGAQFWLTDDAATGGFRGVAHGPADFVHAGNGPFQAGWSHANATYANGTASCINRGRVQREVKPCEICVTLDADAPGRTRSTSCQLPAPGSYTNSSDWSEHTCESCGSVAADCNSIEWKSGPLSRNATTKTWTREQQIHTVHVVFSTHFDVGCAWNVHTVMDLFFHRYIPQILNVQEGLREMGYSERLPYLMQPWISSLYVDCPPNMVFDASPNSTLICPTKDEVARYEDAIRRGDILLQAVPFNLQPEAMSPGLFEGSMAMVRTMCRKYNMSDDACGTVLSGRDVPGLTRGILPLLKKHGVVGISVGTNGCVEPSFPWADGAIKSMQPFVWRDDASDTEIISIWEKGYGPGEFKGRGSVQTLPSGHALAFQFMSDNAGSVSSVTETLAYYRSLQMSFPGAKVMPSSLDAFYAEALKVKAQLRTVSGEIGDGTNLLSHT